MKGDRAVHSARRQSPHHLTMAQNVVVPPFDTAPEIVVGGTPQSVFAFEFPFWQAADVLVYVDGEALDPADYTVAGFFIQNGSPVEGGYGSGEVTLNTPVANVTVTLDRFVVGDRETQFGRSAPLPMPTLNSDLNKLTARQQDIRRRQLQIEDDFAAVVTEAAAEAAAEVAQNVADDADRAEAAESGAVAAETEAQAWAGAAAASAGSAATERDGADAAKVDAQGAATQAAADLLAIQQIASGAPDAPSVLNKAFKDGSNIEAAAFRDALELGDAALKDTGTAAGTLAAGDDSRIVGAAQASENLGDLTDADAAVENLGLAPLTLNVGPIQSGASNLIAYSRTVTQGAGDGTSQVYDFVNRIYAQGSNNYDYVRAQYSGTHIDTTGGTTTNADGLHQYVWVGGAGNVTYSQVIAAHLRVDGPGDVTNEAVLFRGVSTTLGAGAAVTTIKGLSFGQLGDASKVTNVYGVDVEDTSAASVVIGYRSQISAGANKYAFFGAGTADSAFGGKVGIGQTTAPLWTLTVKSSDPNWAADIQNDHSSIPSGIRVRYTGSAPSSGENYFFFGSDTSGQKVGIASNGRYQIGANYVLNSRQAAVTAPTGGATVDAEARAAINALINRLQAHGLIS